MKTTAKRLLALVLSLITLLACAAIPASAASGIKVAVDGRNVTFNSDLGSPYIDKNGRTMVPFRAIANFMDGVDVEWSDRAIIAMLKKVVPYQSSGGQVTKFGVGVFFPVGTNLAITMVQTFRADGSTYAKYYRVAQMDTQSTVRSGRTYAPIRYLAEALNYTVGWNNSTRTVTLTAPSGDWAKAFVQSENAKGYDSIVTAEYQAGQLVYFFSRSQSGSSDPSYSGLGEDKLSDGTRIWRFRDGYTGDYLYVTQHGGVFYSTDGGKSYELW